ncbi:MAG: ABC transporter permease [Armatimonadetes bacterium]|nr:ABC transporter permease [Armatimonadota bacterium]
MQWLNYRALGMLIALAVICGVMTVLTSWRNDWGPPTFVSDVNLRNVLLQCSITTVAAAGMTLVIIGGGIDLSVGSVLALCTVALAVVARALPGAPGIGAGVAGCLIAGAAFGLLNGLLIVRTGAPPFIVTLGTLLVGRGLAYVLADGQTIHAQGVTAGASAPPLLITVGVVAACHLFLSLTPTGRYVYATGGSEEAARLSGVPIGRVRLLTYVASGLCAALGAVIYWLRMAAGNPLAQDGLELYAIAAVIVGGTSLSGGQGDILGTVIGALIMGVLANGLGLLTVPDYWQKVIIGTVIVLAVAGDRLRRRRAP